LLAVLTCLLTVLAGGLLPILLGGRAVLAGLAVLARVLRAVLAGLLAELLGRRVLLRRLVGRA
jgi:hypothetical protein